MNEIKGWLTTEEGDALRNYARGGICLEIGSFHGKSSVWMAQTARRLYCVDTFKADGSGQNQLDDYETLTPFLKNIRPFDNVVPIIGPSSLVVPAFSDNYFDFIFIDGMHDYESVKEDIRMCFPKLRVGGKVAFHDYGVDCGWDGVLKAVNEAFGKPDVIHGCIAVVTKHQ